MLKFCAARGVLKISNDRKYITIYLILKTFRNEQNNYFSCFLCTHTAKQKYSLCTIDAYFFGYNIWAYTHTYIVIQLPILLTNKNIYFK